jgi:hypothetical protein
MQFYYRFISIRRIGSFQLLMFTVENYHTFCNALTAGTLQIAYGYPLVIIWLLAHVFISLLPFPLLNINFSIELNKWFLKLFSFFRAFWSYLIDYMMKPADSSSGAVLVPCLCANYSVWQISLWDHIIPDKEHANLQLEVKSKYPLMDQVKFFSPLLASRLATTLQPHAGCWVFLDNYWIVQQMDQ